jgi:hypothetical protein
MNGRYLLVLSVLCLSVSSLAYASPCTSGTFANNVANVTTLAPAYSSASVCTIDNLQFSNFSITSSTSGGYSLPTPVSVTVVTTAGDEGFNFNPGLSVGVGNNADYAIGFTVTAINGATIDDLDIVFNGVSSNGGLTNYSETISNAMSGSTSLPSDDVQLSLGTPPPLGTTTQTDNLAVPATSLNVLKDFGVSCDSGSQVANCTATVSEVVNTFSNTVTPEPATGVLWITGIGLIGFGFLMRRRNAQAL